MIPRRRFLAVSGLSLPMLLLSQEKTPAEAAQSGRKIVIRVGEGFGDASRADIRAVLESAADSIWRHCPNTRWEHPGFEIYQSEESPIINFDHRPNGWVAVGLTVKGTYWAQFAFQFAHEFCHALAGHSNDWRKTWIRGRKANHWLEETLCETASLFALRAMAKTWAVAPPYPNWKGFAPKLETYAAERIAATKALLPEGGDFLPWLRENEASLRGSSTLREKNTLIATRLLPLFETEPTGWEAMAAFNLGPRRPENSLAEHFRDWQAASPEAQGPFLRKMAAVLGVS